MVISYHSIIRYVSLWCCLAWWGGSALAQAPAPPTPATPAPLAAHSTEGLVRPDTIATRKVAAQTRLDALEHLLLSPEEAEAARATLEQQIKVLTALEAAFQKRASYTTQLATLADQVQELNTARKTLASRPPRTFPEVNDQLRLDHENQLQTTRTTLDGLRQDRATGELRLTNIAKDLEQRLTTRSHFEHDLMTARSEAAKATEQKSPLIARLELLDLRQQLQQAEIDMLEAEREWLTKRGPLLDAQFGMAQTRYAVLQQELETIKNVLGKAISQETAALATSEDAIERRLQQSTDPTEIVMLKVHLDTIKLRQGTTEYRQQANLLSDRVVEQEKRNAYEKQEIEHLTTLVEKYASGERIGRRLQNAFTRLQHEQLRHGEAAMRTMEVDLNALAERELDLEELLYAFDQQVEIRLRDLTLALHNLPPKQREAKLADVSKALEAHREALREQKQALTALVQEQTKLIALRHAYKRLLDEGSQFVLTKLFWLRDAQTMGGRLLQEALMGLSITAGRVQTTLQNELALLPLGTADALRFWGLGAFFLLALPLLAFWLSTRLRQRITVRLSSDTAYESLATRGGVACLIIVQTVIWPGYLALLVWAWPRVMLMGHSGLNLDLPLELGLQLVALVWWGWLVGRAFLHPRGWIQRYERFNREVCRALQRTMTVGALVTSVFLIPRFMLLNAPGGPEAVAASLALARLCFTTFQLVLLILIAVVGRRGSRLMTALLARSQHKGGTLWRHWTFIYLIVLAGISTALGLDVLGYHYASRALLLRSGEALLVILILLSIDHEIMGALERFVARRRAQESLTPAGASPSFWSLLETGRPLVHMFLFLVGISVLEQVYGVQQGIFGMLNDVHLLEVGRDKEGQPVWLGVDDVLLAVLIVAATILFARHLPDMSEVLLFPYVQWDAGLRYTFLTLSRYVLLFFALWRSLALLHVNWSSIQWIVAAVSVGVGFGLQEIVSNFVSGLIILLERPIRVDDVVTVGDQTGVVKRITIRATAIQNVDNQTIIIPNKDFIAQRVTNWTLGDTHVRLVLPVGVAYGSNMDLVKRLLLEAVTNHPRVLTTPPPSVFLRAFGDSALQWEIWCFVPQPRDRLSTAHDLLLHIEQAFRQHNITMPFPQRDVHLHAADAALLAQAHGNGQMASPLTAEAHARET